MLMPLQQPLSRGIDEAYAPVDAGGDQTAADRVNDVLVQRLQVFQLAALLFQLNVRLSQLGAELSRQVGDRGVREQVDEDTDLKTAQIRPRHRIGADDLEIRQLQYRPAGDERQCRGQEGPRARQQDAGNDDDKRIKKCER